MVRYCAVLFWSVIYFPLLAISVGVVVSQVYARMMMQLLWRSWLNDHLLDRWLMNGRYYQLNLVRGDHVPESFFSSASKMARFQMFIPREVARFKKTVNRTAEDNIQAWRSPPARQKPLALSKNRRSRNRLRLPISLECLRAAAATASFPL